MKPKIHRYSYGPITSLQIEMTRYEYPSSVFAMFNDGKNLQLTYVPTWRQCFAYLRTFTSQRVSPTDYEPDKTLVYIERPFRHHVTIPWTDMTHEDWYRLCLTYREEMEQEEIILKGAILKE